MTEIISLPDTIIGVGNGFISAAVLSGMLSVQDGFMIARSLDENNFSKDILEKIFFKDGKFNLFSSVSGDLVSQKDISDFSRWSREIENNTHDKYYSEEKLLCIKYGINCPIGDFAADYSELKMFDEFVFAFLGKLWRTGKNIKWSQLYLNKEVYKIPLPTYCFDKQVVKIGRNVSEENKKNVKQDVNLSAVEKIAWIIWSDILKTETINSDDDIFSLGGDSIHQLDIIQKLTYFLGVDINFAEINEHPKFHEFCCLIEQKLHQRHII